MSSKKSSGKGGSGKKAGSAKKKAATPAKSVPAGRKSSRMTPSGRSTAGKRGAQSSTRRQSPKNTGPGADPRGAGSDVPAAEGFDLAHGRYRDEVVDVPEKSEFIVRRTFLASKTEFEVEVSKAALGKSAAQLNKLPRGEREQLVKDAAKVALDLRTQQLSSEIDNSDLGGKSIARARGGGTFNPENPTAPRGQLGASPDVVDQTGTVGDEAEAGRKGEGAASTSTGAPATEAVIRGTPNDRTDTAGSSKSAETTGGAAS